MSQPIVRQHNRKVTTMNSLVDLNETSTNFQVAFDIKSDDPKTPFFIQIIDENGNVISNGESSGGQLQGSWKQVTNVHQNYGLTIRAEKECNCVIRIERLELPIENVAPPVNTVPDSFVPQPVQQQRQQQFVPPQESFFQTHKFAIIVVFIAVAVGGYYYYTNHYQKNDKSPYAGKYDSKVSPYDSKPLPYGSLNRSYPKTYPNSGLGASSGLGARAGLETGLGDPKYSMPSTRYNPGPYSGPSEGRTNYRPYSGPSEGRTNYRPYPRPSEGYKPSLNTNMNANTNSGLPETKARSETSEAAPSPLGAPRPYKSKDSSSLADRINNLK